MSNGQNCLSIVNPIIAYSLQISNIELIFLKYSKPALYNNLL